MTVDRSVLNLLSLKSAKKALEGKKLRNEPFFVEAKNKKKKSNEEAKKVMKKIPILFLKDDEILIEMYKTYFETRGYCSVVIRGGEEGLERAIAEGPSLVTFNSYTTTSGKNGHAPIIIFTYQSKAECHDRAIVKSAVMSSEVFSEIESSLGYAA